MVVLSQGLLSSETSVLVGPCLEGPSLVLKLRYGDDSE